VRTRNLLQLLALCFAACHSSGGGEDDAGLGNNDDLGVDDLSIAGGDLAGADLTFLGDAGLSACVTPTGLSRGRAWVRQNPPFVAGLVVATGAPTVAAVNDYFDAFHANAVHLWASGLPTEIAGWSAAGHAGFRYVSWVQADGTSTSNGMALGGAAPLPGRIGYQIGDEPQDAATLTTMLASAHTIRTSDPDALTIVNVNDSNNVDTLRPTAINSADVDVLSYDHYTYKRSSYGAISKVRTSALAAGKPYWRYARSYYAQGSTPESTEADLRWDAFVGAVHGFTGFTWFLYQIDPTNPDLAVLLFATKGDFTSAKTAFYSVAANLNVQLIQLGRTLALLQSVDVRYVSAIAILNPGGIVEWGKGAGNDPYLTKLAPAAGTMRDAVVGFFRDDCDEPYVILQNAGHPGAEFPNSSDQPATFHVELDFSTSTDPTIDPSALVSLDLTTGAATILALSGSGGVRSIDLAIPAGGIVVWKYKNARAMARQP